MEYAMALADTLNPPPLSPLFRHGGFLQQFNEDLFLISFFLVVLLVLERTVVPLVLRKSLQDKNARYFLLHAIINTVVVVYSFPDMLRMFLDPLHAFTGPSHTMVSNSAIAAVHLYHVFFFSLNSQDVFHHLTFVVFLCGIAIPYKQVGGALNNVGCFILSGLPGGLDYYLLVGVKEGWVDKGTEKSVNASLQMWVRASTMSVYGFLCWQTYLLGNLHPQVSPWALLLVGLLHFTNGIHYSSLAVFSLGRYTQLQQSQKRN